MPGVLVLSDGSPSSQYSVRHVASEFSDSAPPPTPEAQRDTNSGDLPARSGRGPRSPPRIPRHRISILDSIFSFFSATPRKFQ